MSHRADSFLQLVRRAQRGKLKIYLGYCAGVGKTYQMLLDGQRFREDGIDVVVGLVETHGRPETECLLQGMEVIPRRRVVYRGIEISDMDAGAIMARRPGVVLVDELAHTNVPGSRNPKRYQDVEEILAAGIHVISTLNIQHLESLYDTVERITGVRVRERIPDRMVTDADQIVNVDLTTEDLRRRLEEGKVYTADRVETALTHFFKPSNLEQLRELTLRELAAQIDSRRRAPFADETPSSPDQVMVCLSSRGPNSEALLRYASRLAGRLNRNWYALYVRTWSESPAKIDAETQRVLSNALTLAQQLGATVFTYKGDDVVKTILQFAKEYRVGHIVVGRSGRKIPLWKRLSGKTPLIQRLVEEAKGTTIVVLDTREVGIGPIAQLEKPAMEATRVIGLPAAARPAIALLKETAVLIWDEPLEKETAMRQLLAECCRRDKTLPEEDAWQALTQREQQGSTFLGEDVALPHARLKGVEHAVVGLGLAKQGVSESATGRSVRIVFLLLSPVSPPEVHVRHLSLISRLSQQPLLRQELLAARTAGEANRVLKGHMADFEFQAAAANGGKTDDGVQADLDRG
ncbi:MAG: PTS sugar transporter subunit IIA [Desulfobacterales bacterium]|jgi:two-component system sensor histidine kinase KdpD|nr:PTS sugar transporter subunit IIA [Desulfobacterales bacterium]